MGSDLDETDLDAFLGQEGATLTAPDPVNAAMIHHWCQVFGNGNRSYLDADFARSSRFGQIIAPAAMAQVWMMGEYGQSPPADSIAELYSLLDDLGYTAIVATNSQQTYHRPVYLADQLRSTRRIVAISDEKRTRLGTGRFITNEIEVVEGSGKVVAKQILRHFKFRPQQSATPPAAAPPVKPRPRPALTSDIEFYFNGARAGQLLIQRCNECGDLQHPPWPACSSCRSLSLHPEPMSGGGELYSFTVIHSPTIQPFEPPYVVALVALDEGPRVVAGLIGIEPGDVKIGTRLQAEIVQFDEELALPMFRPATSRDSQVSGAAREYKTLSPQEIRLGTRLPELTIPITHTFITAGALATRDFQPVHHDTAYAVARGLSNVITNIWTTHGVISRFLTDWSGPEAMITGVDLRLGDSNYPGDVLTLSGQVSEIAVGTDPGDTVVTVEFKGDNGRSVHVAGSATLSLLESTLVTSDAERID